LGNGVLLNDEGAKQIRVSFTELHKLGDLRSGSIDPWPGVADQNRWNKKIDDYEIVGEAMDRKRGVESREGMWEDALPEGITGIGGDDLDALFVDEDTDEEMNEEYLAADHGFGVEEGGDGTAGGQDEVSIVMYVDENGDQGEQQAAPREMHQNNENNEISEFMHPHDFDNAHFDSIGGSFFDEAFQNGSYLDPPPEDMPFEPGPYLRTLYMG